MAKKEKKHQLVDILRVEGIMAQGDGLNPKIVMRDKRLTPEAKCIYSYLASFAGGGNQAFPSRNIMLEELQMSKDRYYKHLKYLTDADYIRVERTKNSTGTFDKNIYTIVALPNPVVTDKNVTEDMKKNENTVDQNSKPAGSQKKPGIKKLHVKERASVMELRSHIYVFNTEFKKYGDGFSYFILSDIKCPSNKSIMPAYDRCFSCVLYTPLEAEYIFFSIFLSSVKVYSACGISWEELSR